MTAPVVLRTVDHVDNLRRALSERKTSVVVDPAFEHDRALIERLAVATQSPGVGSASPVPVSSERVPDTYELHAALPPPASIPVPCRIACAFGAEALASLPGIPDGCTTISDLIVATAERMLQHGWRHVAAPGVALAWDPTDSTSITPNAAWTRRSVPSLAGPANVALEAHVSWASSRINRLRVVVDGACIADGPNTGTQHLVIEVSRWLKRVRPNAEVVLATFPDFAAAMRADLGKDNVEVVARQPDIDADVVYRPYQMLYASELPFVLEVGRRGLVSQLDMIGFANPYYHPSAGLFFFARNIQRHLMRTLDGVTFISEFGRASAVAECPDLEPGRLHVVSCGADPTPMAGVRPSGRTSPEDARFLVCLSSTFWHKNRAHAIATFDHLAREHGYGGDLIIAGPEPFYGRSLDEEGELLARLDPKIAARVHRLGHVPDDEKWWLLRNADLTLYPSIVEGFGLVPFESASVGTPCLASASTAPGELLAGTSAVVTTWNIETWAGRAADLVHDSAAARTNVEQIRRAGAHHTWRRCAERTWLAIDHALASPIRLHHMNDGGRMTHIAPAPDRPVPAASARFNMMRLGPAVARRIRRRRPLPRRSA